ncbi:hypothetical protein MTO96_036595 [Rhipicephalus appendiculatus]
MVARRPASSWRRVVTISLSCSGNEGRVTCLVSGGLRCVCCFPWSRSAHVSPAWWKGKRPLEREWLRWTLRRLAAGVTERLLLDAAEMLEVALESRELAPLGPRERLRPRCRRLRRRCRTMYGT